LPRKASGDCHSGAHNVNDRSMHRPLITSNLHNGLVEQLGQCPRPPGQWDMSTALRQGERHGGSRGVVGFGGRHEAKHPSGSRSQVLALVLTRQDVRGMKRSPGRMGRSSQSTLAR